MCIAMYACMRTKSMNSTEYLSFKLYNSLPLYTNIIELNINSFKKEVKNELSN